MADDKTREGKRDGDRIAGDRGYEIEYLAETTGISRSQAIALIERHCNDRATLVREARKLAK